MPEPKELIIDLLLPFKLLGVFVTIELIGDETAYAFTGFISVEEGHLIIKWDFIEYVIAFRKGEIAYWNWFYSFEEAKEVFLSKFNELCE